MATTNARAQLMRGTSAQWASANPILRQGELGYDTTNKTVVCGDGSTPWGGLSSVLTGATQHNVKGYGAVGDGITNDTTAVQAALTAAVGGGIVYFPPGTYLCGNLTIPGVMTLLADGTATLKLAAATNDHLLEASLVNGIRIFGLSFNGNQANQTGDCSAIWFETCDNCELRNVSVINGYGDVGSSYGAVTLKNCAAATITDCRVTYAKYSGLGIYGATGGGHSIVGGDYSSCGYSGIQTVLTPNVRLMNVRANANGTSNISLNGPYSEAIGCIGTNSVADHGINLGHDTASTNASGSRVIGGYYAGNLGYGVYVYGGSTQTQSNVAVIGAYAYNNNDDGIRLSSGTADCLVIDCISASAPSGGKAGIRVGGQRCAVRDCSIVNSAGYGLYIDTSADYTFVSNMTFNNNTGQNFYDLGDYTESDGCLYSNTAVSTSSTNALETLKTYTMKANVMGRDGSLRIVAFGTKVNSGGGDKQIILNFGSTAICDFTQNNEADSWRIEADVVNSGGASTQRYSCIAWDGTAVVANNCGGMNENTAADVAITVQTNCATAGDTVSCRSLRVGRTTSRGGV